MDSLAAARVPFRAELLGDGALWRACYTRGSTPRWQRNAKLLPSFKNRAGQAYTLSGAAGGGTVVNYGEVLGRRLYFKAEGSFVPANTATSRCPKSFNVAIDQGGLVLVERLPLLSSAISGPGFLRCLYIDESLRIFESPRDSPDRWEEAGLQVVQVRDAVFDDAVEGEL